MQPTLPRHRGEEDEATSSALQPQPLPSMLPPKPPQSNAATAAASNEQPAAAAWNAVSVSAGRAVDPVPATAASPAALAASAPSVSAAAAGAAATAASAVSAASDSVVFRLRLVEMDHSLAPPLVGLDPMHSSFSSLPTQLVPVLRLFGRTPSGQSAVLHVHNALPYLFVELTAEAWDASMKIEREERRKAAELPGRGSGAAGGVGGAPAAAAAAIDEDSPAALSVFLSRLGSCIERALRELSALDSANRRAAMGDSTTARANAEESQKDERDNRAASTSAAPGAAAASVGPNRRALLKPYIHSLCVVRARSIFGYSTSDAPFIQLRFYDPACLKRVGAILQSGCILGHAFEVFESHIPFHLQFLSDYNLFGMDFVDVGEGVNFRQPLPPPPPPPPKPRKPPRARAGSQQQQEPEEEEVDDFAAQVHRTSQRAVKVTSCNSEEPRHGWASFGGAAAAAAAAEHHSASRIEVAYENDSDSSSALAAGDRKVADPNLAARQAGESELAVHHGASRLWTSESTPPHLWASLRLSKTTRCPLEADVDAAHILNATKVHLVPLSQTAAEQKMVQSLASIWKNERERRRAVKRAARDAAAAAAAASSTASSAAPSCTPDSLAFTPLTPRASPPRQPLPPSNLNRAYAAHIGRVAAMENRRQQHATKRKRGSEEQEEGDVVAAGAAAAAASSLPPSTPARPATAAAAAGVSSASQQLPSSASPPDDLAALLREIDACSSDSDNGLDDDAAARKSSDPSSAPRDMFTRALHEARVALSQQQRRHLASQSPSQFAVPPATPTSSQRPSAAATPRSAIPRMLNVDQLPSAFSMTQQQQPALQSTPRRAQSSVLVQDGSPQIQPMSLLCTQQDVPHHLSPVIASQLPGYSAAAAASASQRSPFGPSSFSQRPPFAASAAAAMLPTPFFVSQLDPSLDPDAPDFDAEDEAAAAAAGADGELEGSQTDGEFRAGGLGMSQSPSLLARFGGSPSQQLYHHSPSQVASQAFPAATPRTTMARSRTKWLDEQLLMQSQVEFARDEAAAAAAAASSGADDAATNADLEALHANEGMDPRADAGADEDDDAESDGDAEEREQREQEELLLHASEAQEDEEGMECVDEQAQDEAEDASMHDETEAAAADVFAAFGSIPFDAAAADADPLAATATAAASARSRPYKGRIIPQLDGAGDESDEDQGPTAAVASGAATKAATHDDVIEVTPPAVAAAAGAASVPRTRGGSGSGGKSRRNAMPALQLVTTSSSAAAASNTAAAVAAPAAAATPAVPASSKAPPRQLHYERILESRWYTPPAAGSTAAAPLQLQYKMQLCYSDGTLASAAEGGVKWFNAPRITRTRGDLVELFNATQQARAQQAASAAATAASGMKSPELRRPTSAARTAAASASAHKPIASNPVSAAAALVLQARARHSRSQVTAAAFATTAAASAGSKDKYLAQRHARQMTQIAQHNRTGPVLKTSLAPSSAAAAPAAEFGAHTPALRSSRPPKKRLAVAIAPAPSVVASVPPAVPSLGAALDEIVIPATPASLHAAAAAASVAPKAAPEFAPIASVAGAEAENGLAIDHLPPSDSEEEAEVLSQAPSEPSPKPLPAMIDGQDPPAAADLELKTDGDEVIFVSDSEPGEDDEGEQDDDEAMQPGAGPPVGHDEAASASDHMSLAAFGSQALLGSGAVPPLPHLPSPLKSQLPFAAAASMTMPVAVAVSSRVRRKLHLPPKEEPSALPLTIQSTPEQSAQREAEEAKAIQSTPEHSATCKIEEATTHDVPAAAVAHLGELLRSDPSAIAQPEPISSTPAATSATAVPSLLSLSLPMSDPSTAPPSRKQKLSHPSSPMRISASPRMDDQHADKVSAPVAADDSSAPVVAAAAAAPSPPPLARRVVANIYTRDPAPYTLGSSLRFERLQVHPSTVLHTLRTAPPTAQELLDSCSRFGLWPEAPSLLAPFFSSVEHYKQHLASMAHAGSTISAQAYAAAAMGNSPGGATALGVQPPRNRPEFMQSALPTAKPDPALLMQVSTPEARPQFSDFHDGEASAQRTPAAPFQPTVPPLSVRSLADFARVVSYAPLPPSLADLASSSKHWHREIKSMTRREEAMRRSRARRHRRQQQLLADTQASTAEGCAADTPMGAAASAIPAASADALYDAPSSSDSSASDSSSESESEAVALPAHLPRPASPKHEENCLLSLSYFQAEAPPSSQHLLPAAGGALPPLTSGSKRKGSGRKSVASAVRTAPKDRARVRLLHSAAKSPAPASALIRKRNHAETQSARKPLLLDSPSADLQIEGAAPVFQPAVLIETGAATAGGSVAKSSPVLVDHPLTPASKVARVSAELASPHLSSPASLTLSAGVSILPITARSRGSHTQAKELGSQLEVPTPSIGATPIRYNAGSAAGSVRVDSSEQQHLSILSIEMHACSRLQLMPDPKHDPVVAIVYCLRNQVHGEHEHQPDLSGILLCPHLPEVAMSASTTQVHSPVGAAPADESVAAAAVPPPPPPPRSCPSCSPHCPLPLLVFPCSPADGPPLVQYFPSESALLAGFVRLVQDLDPDVMMGWEMQKAALGYLVERAQYLGRKPSLQEELSRAMPPPTAAEQARGKRNAPGGKDAPQFHGAERDKSNPASAYSWSHSSGLTIPGRIVLNLWRIMRDELKLCSYSFENVAWHILQKRFPHFPPFVKHRWFCEGIRQAGGLCTRVAASDHSVGSASSSARQAYTSNGLARLLQHLLDRVHGSVEIVDRLDLIGRTAELARVFGIKFFSVLDRGSQYRVESMMLRLSRPQNLLLLSISPQQRARQPALECIPLIMEPVSAFYTDPVIVLDFQSLYPSVMIAYNICYSTCLGKVPEAIKRRDKGGVQNGQNGGNAAAAATAAAPPAPAVAAQAPPASQLSALSPSQHSDAGSQLSPRPPAVAAAVPPRPVLVDSLMSPASSSLPSTQADFEPFAASPPRAVPLGGTHIPRNLSLLGELESSGQLWVSGNGVMFARPSTRQGILPRLLREILETRVMVKKSMAREEVLRHRGLHRLLNARQFGLKLISNVTYGYTSAGFSGRMPCAEIADSIVQTGRDTLERAIRLVESDPAWKARVVYGDTDSLFVHLPGRSKEEAFRIGREIAARVSAANPQPIKLQMDKVYQPCLLLSKKRYVGWRFDSEGQVAPVLEAKGIESVRRDGCPLVVKSMEAILGLLFSTKDLSLVRSYLERTWSRIWTGRLALNEALFAKEVRLGNYRQPPLAAVLATRLASLDPRLSPLYAERVPYVIVDGPPAARLAERLQHPLALLLRPDRFRLCASYYAEIVLNRPIMRVLDLVGVDIRTWFAAWPRPRRQALAPPIEARGAAEISIKGKDDLMAQAAGLPPRMPPAPLPAGSSARARRGGGNARGGSHGLPVSRGSLSRLQVSAFGSSRRTIDQYYASQHCPLCDQLTQKQRTFCDECMERATTGVGANLARGAWVRLQWSAKVAAAESSYAAALATCRRCVGDGSLQGCGGGVDLVSGPLHLASSTSISLASSDPHVLVPCISLDCPNLFVRQTKSFHVKQVGDIAAQLDREQSRD